MINYADFEGTLPYATELFGVYQPLLGWKGKQAQQRVYDEQVDRTRELVAELLSDSRVRQAAASNTAVLSLDGQLPPRLPYWIGSSAAKRIRSGVLQFAKQYQHLPANKEEWSAIVGRTTPNISVQPRTSEMALARGVQQPFASTQEAVIADTLDYLSRKVPQVLQALFTENGKVSWQEAVHFLDPLDNFDTETGYAVLSPIGVINLYREYFFEFKTFLGPPVGHVWVSPGGSLELFEVHTKRTLEERQIEVTTEVTRRSELTTTQQEELSDAVREENQRNESFGISASGGVSAPFYHAEASVDYELQESNAKAEESAHKQLRQQTEKLSNEIRRNFKTTFRTQVEVEDTSSRRYVLQNNTDKLANYELRRKMRQVGVQVQHLGTQLCWQVYVDEPGDELGIGELVHIAKPGDVASGIQPPEAPTLLQPKEVELKVNFPLHVVSGRFDPDEGYTEIDPGTKLAPVEAALGEELLIERDYVGESGEPAIIKATKEFVATPPGPGYTLSNILESSIERIDPKHGLPAVDAEYFVIDGSAGRFQIKLHFAAYRDQPEIRFVLKLTWIPPDQKAVQEEYQTQLAEFHERVRREAHAEYVNAVRERVKLARSIAPRPADDLRAEERITVFRRLISQLTQVAQNQNPHVTSELIRTIFDVDKMLYFVAPDWWMPREHSTQIVPRDQTVNQAASASGDELNQAASASGDQLLFGNTGNVINRDQATVLTEDDIVGWDGVAPKDREHYLITEDSQPAQLGASLGWLLQLDGDSHRNAFLNSPWAKAVIPIRPGKEEAALEWLKHNHVEGTDGLDAKVEVKIGDETIEKTIEEAIKDLAKEIAQKGTDVQNSLATETVFEKGFDPLEGGFRSTGESFEIFDQWTEILPTDQVVAVEYDPTEHQ